MPYRTETRRHGISNPLFSAATMPSPHPAPLERRRRNPVSANGIPQDPSVPYSRRESDLAKARINKWLDFADTSLRNQTMSSTSQKSESENEDPAAPNSDPEDSERDGTP